MLSYYTLDFHKLSRLQLDFLSVLDWKLMVLFVPTIRNQDLCGVNEAIQSAVTTWVNDSYRPMWDWHCLHVRWLGQNVSLTKLWPELGVRLEHFAVVGLVLRKLPEVMWDDLRQQSLRLMIYQPSKIKSSESFLMFLGHLILFYY